jgi:hypothetical protein
MTLMTLVNVTPPMIPALIGRGGSGIKESIIAPSWEMYRSQKAHAQKPRAQKPRAQKPKKPKNPTLRIKFVESDGGVCADIHCTDKNLQACAEIHLTKHAESVIQRFQNRASRPARKPTPRPSHTIFAELPFHLIGCLIGRGGSTMKSLIAEAISDLPYSPEIDDLVEMDQVLEKAFWKVQQHVYTDLDALKTEIDTAQSKQFMSWDPEPDDEGQNPDLVRVTVSAPVSDARFQEFLSAFNKVLCEKVGSILERETS